MNAEEVLKLARRGANYMAKLKGVDHPLDKEDMIQAAALAMYESGEFTFRKARNAAGIWIDSWRYRQRRQCGILDIDDAPEPPTNTPDIPDWISRHLSASQALVLVSVLSGMTYSEIEKMHGIPYRSICTHRQRIRKKLKNLLTKTEHAL